MSATLFFDDEQCRLLREMLEFVPLSPRYIPFIADLMDRVPESVAPPSGADSAPPTPKVPELGGGFTMIAHTPRGVSMLEELDRVLCKVVP